MKSKKNFSLWLFLFIFLTTFSFNSVQKKNTSFLPIKNIEIEGIKYSNKELITSRLEKFKNKSIILIGSNKLKNITNNMAFIKELRVNKIYPDTIKIKVVEYEPIGILNKNNKGYVLIEGGKILEINDKKKYVNLPQVSGNKVEKFFHTFKKSLDNLNFETNLVKQYIFFDINRWDIILENGKILKLPEQNYENSVKEFLIIEKDKNYSLFKVFDFRIKGQLILK